VETVDGEPDFSQWAMQDLVKAPLPSASHDGPAPAMWLGLQSMVELATGRDGKVVVCDATKRGVKFTMGYVEGFRKETHVVLPAEAPRAVADLFSADVAKKVLNNASFRKKLEEAGGANLMLGVIIDRVLQELDVYTPEELESLKAFCKMRGGDEMQVRCGRDGGELFISVIDVVMVAKKCTYETSKKICQRLFQDYWNMDPNGRTEGTDLPPQFFRSLRLQQGRHGGQATLCANAAAIGEILILIPGCELSANLRKDMVRSFLGSGGAVTFQSLLANPRIRDHLREAGENPMVDLVEKEELRLQLRNLSTSVQNLESEGERKMKVLLDSQRVEILKEVQEALGQQDDRLLTRLGRNCEQVSVRVMMMQAMVSGKLADFFSSLKGSIQENLQTVVDEARASGVIEITRNAGTAASHQADQAMLIEKCRPLPSGPEGIALFQEVGELLTVTSYLEDRLEEEEQYVIKHFAVPFSKELKKLKLREAQGGVRPWRAWVQCAWRIQYTEADRATMDELYGKSLWKNKMEKMLELHRPATPNQPRRPHMSANRGGPYSRPTGGGDDPHASRPIWEAFFRGSSRSDDV